MHFTYPFLLRKRPAVNKKERHIIVVSSTHEFSEQSATNRITALSSSLESIILGERRAWESVCAPYAELSVFLTIDKAGRQRIDK